MVPVAAAVWLTPGKGLVVKAVMSLGADAKCCCRGEEGQRYRGYGGEDGGGVLLRKRLVYRCVTHPFYSRSAYRVIVPTPLRRDGRL